ncbi:hypothetical protein DIS24_g5322 [Lasiodiplodia hormozganensis]|uniref:Uncharacterized protein n=1 Tax=Lasiodiplodia hormozganensis TaxID=869390 RepID=A0AA39YKG0_9PEZI|nr:hypothetical protein DIS24_g5322 [Lasiodiplodia hormozganensis]
MVVEIERYTSYGRGGAGNLRRLSDVRAAQTVLVQNKDEEPVRERRRSSVWSTSSSPSSRRDSIWRAATHVFRRHSSADEGMTEPKE